MSSETISVSFRNFASAPVFTLEDFRKSKMRKMDSDQELEACDEKYPYLPPQIPFTRCTLVLISGS
jgi:hypothetical protein